MIRVDWINCNAINSFFKKPHYEKLTVLKSFHFVFIHANEHAFPVFFLCLGLLFFSKGLICGFYGEFLYKFCQ